MKKEVIIVIIILVLIIILNIITQKYTNVKMTELTDMLSKVKESLSLENIEEAKEKMVKVQEEWDNIKEKFVIYLEHNELEKVEMYIIETKSHIETDEISMAIQSVDTCTFVIDHIKEKYEFSLKNIF